MLFTVFTPTYNRAYLLPRLFESLQRQTVRNFEWLVIDDGSTDETAELIKEFSSVADFEIEYIFQKNQGKHIAINNALKKAKGQFYLPVDSDDFLAANCLEISEDLTKECEEINDCAGFTFIRAFEDWQHKPYFTGKNRFLNLNECIMPEGSEIVYVLKTNVAKKFLFPMFADENFCQESVQLIPIRTKHSILFTDYILSYGEYLEDGLSQNLYQRLLQNPKYAMLSIKSKLIEAKDHEEKINLTKAYWDIVYKTRQPKLESFYHFPKLLTTKFLLHKFFKAITKIIVAKLKL